MTITLKENVTAMTMTLQENLSPIEQNLTSAIVESFKDLVIVNVDSSKPIVQPSQEIENPISIIEEPSQEIEYPISIIEEPSQEIENPISIIEEPSKDHPTSITESSPEITTNSFSFQLRPASILKQALASLSDADFNPQGLGLIEVGELGLEITVRNAKSGVVGHLWLKSTGLINFEFSKPMNNKMINLNHIFDNLVDAAANDTITFHHLDGSSQLTFLFGNASPRHFAVDLLEMEASFEKFPNITYASEVVILCDHLRQMIQEYQAAESPKLVSMDISEKVSNVFVGKTDWMYDLVYGIRGMEPDQKHHAWFQLPHCESLKKASFVAAGCLLCLVTDPVEHIMLRFNLRELGDLVYINKAIMIVFNTDNLNEINGLGHLASTASLM